MSCFLTFCVACGRRCKRSHWEVSIGAGVIATDARRSPESSLDVHRLFPRFRRGAVLMTSSVSVVDVTRLVQTANCCKTTFAMWSVCFSFRWLDHPYYYELDIVAGDRVPARLLDRLFLPLTSFPEAAPSSPLRSSIGTLWTAKEVSTAFRIKICTFQHCKFTRILCFDFVILNRVLYSKFNRVVKIASRS